MLSAVWLIPALPLLGALLLLVFGRKLGEPWSGVLATLMVAGSFVAGVVTFLGLLDRPAEERQFLFHVFDWLPVGGFNVDIGFLVDPLSMTMVLFVTGVGALIHLYSIGYMHGDRGYPRFFLYLNLFAFSMLMLVLGDNLLVTFLGWEGVGACSYFLISFWFEKMPNAVAGKKAFVTNRIGDWGYMLGMFLTFTTLGSITYFAKDGSGFLQHASGLTGVTATAIALLLFVGAAGKSAQLPLYVWLPDAMAGPTPVSALIHAATMVTSGVYLMVRVSPVLAQSYHWAPQVIAWIGAITALFAATVAVSQRDIKKVLAYSTVSQLGYMFLAVGSGAYVAAIFHMVTHAFFKALLFLGSGSVIHGMHDEQDMRFMGALRKLMPITASTFIVGWLAIAGVPPFAGFWSKDEILLSAWGNNKALWAIGLVTALLTAYYMSRQVFMVFFGEPRWDQAHHVAGEAEQSAAAVDDERTDVAHGVAVDEHPAPTPHESPWTMWVPLVVLAVLAVLGGGLNLPFNHDVSFLANWLEPVVHATEVVPDVATATKVGLAVVAIIAALAGIALAAAVYLKQRVRAVEPELLLHAYHYDDALAAFFGGPGEALAEGTAMADKLVIDGAVNGAGTLVRAGGSRLRVVQTGYVRNYALGIAGGAVLALGWFLVRAGL
ncbi:MAG: nuoL [Acidimicrobiales bacterium]|nr:nuoL [Acidimicrobiales bacterium]